ncbi:MAG: type IV conjugative transfer system protein TraL [Candidatus Competibacteraceae bacterium]
MEPLEIPRGVDDTHQFLLWSIDEMLPLFLLALVGVLSQQLTLCLLLGALVVRLLRRYRDRRPDGYLYHALYWVGLTPLKGYSLINPYRRRFLP